MAKTKRPESSVCPGEYCNPIAQNWFYVEGDRPQSDKELLKLFQETGQRGVNFLLNVPPNKHGLIPESPLMPTRVQLRLQPGTH